MLHHAARRSTESVEDEVWEPILYLPSNPNVATLVDGLIVTPTPRGEWAPPDSWWNYLLPPLGVVAVNVLQYTQY